MSGKWSKLYPIQILALLCSLPIPVAQAVVVKVAVVGAGPAGATVAAMLQQQQIPGVEFDVQVYESQDRVGGRAFSKVIRLPNGREVSINLGTQMNFEKLQDLLDANPILNKLGLSEELTPADQNITVISQGTDGSTKPRTIPRIGDTSDFSELEQKSRMVAATGILSQEDLASSALAAAKVREDFLLNVPFDNLVKYLDHPGYENIDKITADEFLRTFRAPLRPSFTKIDIFNPFKVFSVGVKAMAYYGADGQAKTKLASEAVTNLLWNAGYREAGFSRQYVARMVESMEKIVEFSDLKTMSASNFLWQLKWVMDGGKIVVAKDGWNRLPEKLLRDLPKENLHLNSTVETIADAPGGGQTLSIVGKDGKSKAVHADIVFNSADTNVALKMKKSSPELEAMLKANSYTSTIAVHLVTDTPSQDIFGARTPALTAESGLLQKVGGITFQTGLRGENLGGYEIPGIFLQTEPAKELIQRSVAESWTDERMKKEVMALILPDLKSLSAKDDSGAIQKLVGSLEKGEIVSVKAWDQALPEFQKNYLGLIKKYEDSLTKEWQEFVSGRSKNPPSYFYIGQARFGRTIANTITQTSHEVEKFAGMVKRKPEAFAAPGFPGASAMGCPAAYKLAE